MYDILIYIYKGSKYETNLISLWNIIKHMNILKIDFKINVKID